MEDNKVKFCLLKVRHIDNTETKKSKQIAYYLEI